MKLLNHSICLLVCALLFLNCGQENEERANAKKTIQEGIENTDNQTETIQPNTASVKSNTETITEKKLNVSYDEIMNFLSDYFKMDMPIIENNTYKYTGKYKKFISIELLGEQDNIATASLTLRPLDVPKELHQDYSAMLVRFLLNAIPESNEEEISEWVLGKMGSMAASGIPREEKSFYGKVAEISFSAKLSFLMMTVRPQ